MAESQLEILVQLRDMASDQLKQLNQTLSGTGEASQVTSKATDQLTYAYAGMGRIMRSVIPSMGEMTNYMNSAVSVSQKLQSALGGVSQGMTYAIITTKNMSASMQAFSMIGANLGLALIQFGVQSLQSYSNQAAIAKQLNEEMTRGDWLLRDSSIAVAKAYIAQTEALVSVDEKTRNYVEWLKSALAEAEEAKGFDALKDKLSLITGEEKKQQDAQKAINDYIVHSNLSFGEAIEKMRPLVDAYNLQVILTQQKVEAEQAALEINDKQLANLRAMNAILRGEYEGGVAARGGGGIAGRYQTYSQLDLMKYGEKFVGAGVMTQAQYESKLPPWLKEAYGSKPIGDININIDGQTIATVSSKYQGGSYADRAQMGG